jgi:uncharacterized integral membrane protein
MRIKTMIVVLITALLTIVLMQNTDSVEFGFLWTDFRLPKLLIMTGFSVVAFILGLLVGRPKRVKQVGGDAGNNRSNLSEEDQDYIK